MQHNSLVARYARGNLVLQILVGIVFGILLATVSPSHAESVGLIGSLFVGALKAIAPILVFILVAASIANQRKPTHLHAPNRCFVPNGYVLRSACSRGSKLPFPDPSNACNRR